jgi:hypothetical protein
VLVITISADDAVEYPVEQPVTQQNAEFTGNLLTSTSPPWEGHHSLCHSPYSILTDTELTGEFL